MKIVAIAPVFSAERDGDRFCTNEQGKRHLEILYDRFAGKKDELVGLYVPENPESDYNDDEKQFGRVIAAVRILPLKPNETASSFPSGCVEFIRNELRDRWPYGLPSETVFYSSDGGPILRDIVMRVMPDLPFGDYTRKLHDQGPMLDLGQRGKMTVAECLTAEIIHTMARNSLTRIR